jgi:hypothetical protein
MDKVKYTCSGEVQYATCVRYEGTVNSQSSLNNDSCLDLGQTTLDIYTQIGSILDDMSTANLGDRCLNYTLENAKLKIKNVLIKHEEEICDLKEEINTLKTTAVCDLDITDCNLDFNGLVDACGNTPTKLGEVLNLIFSKITE